MTELANPFRGKIAPLREIVSVRPISRDDLPRLLKPRDASATHPKKIKEAHHTVAKLLSIGLDQERVATLTGYSITRIVTLAASPAMAELVAQYRATINESFAETIDLYNDLLVSNKVKAERMIADRLDEAMDDGDTLPFRDLLAISRDAADRTGHPKGRVNINANADFASLLEQRIARAKTINSTAGEVKTLEATSPSRQTAPAEPHQQPSIRRIA